MSLTFGTGSLALASWGFSVGDIAALAGAGRKIGTWLTAHLSDRALFDWMDTDVDTIFTRRGLLDVEQLHRRWDQKIVLLQNGEVRTFEPPAAETACRLNRMDRWTWLMTLITAALNAAASSADMREVVTKVLLRAFDDWAESQEFIRREIPSHLAGWSSAACVRGISLRARDTWAVLCGQGKHPEGYIPSSENSQLVQFIMWLINGHGNDKDSKRYHTASADIFSFAMLLEDLGVLLKTTEDSASHFDETHPVVQWSSKLPYSVQNADAKRQRRSGMRIPLAFIEEAGSIFPNIRNEIREIMKEAIDAVRNDGIKLFSYLPFEDPTYAQGPSSMEQTNLEYQFSSSSDTPIPRLEGDLRRFVNWFMMEPSPAVCKALLNVIARMTDEEKENSKMVAFALDNQEQSDDRLHDSRLVTHDYGDAVTSIQAFVLGYWYALLAPLLDTSQMPWQEAFGAWGWSDMKCLNFIRQCVTSKRRVDAKNKNSACSLRRFEVLKLVSYLFGGADLPVAQSVKVDALGVHGKLSVLHTSLLGSWDTGKFALLDIDSTCIPSSTSGIVLPGRPRALTRQDSSNVRTNKVADLLWSEIEPGKGPDFTTHIEPDWDYDSQTCLLTYRYRGRVIHRMDPRQLDVVLTRQQAAKVWSNDTDQNAPGQDPPYHPATEYCWAPLTAFFGGNTIHPADRLANSDTFPPGYEFQPVFINTIGLPNAYNALLCMYKGWTHAGSNQVTIVSGKEDLEDTMRRFAKVVIFTDL